jgi:hypothetical protein
VCCVLCCVLCDLSGLEHLPVQSQSPRFDGLTAAVTFTPPFHSHLLSIHTSYPFTPPFYAHLLFYSHLPVQLQPRRLDGLAADARRQDRASVTVTPPCSPFHSHPAFSKNTSFLFTLALCINPSSFTVSSSQRSRRRRTEPRSCSPAAPKAWAWAASLWRSSPPTTSWCWQARTRFSLR